jgi:hypothetical protein
VTVPAEEVRAVASEAARQVRRCYRSPVVPTAARRIVTRLRVRFAPDGSLAGLPQIVFQQNVTPETAPWAGRMAEAATGAVLRCAPYRLPADHYRGGWDQLDLTFSPGLLA